MNDRGLRGEDEAARYLDARGYRVVCRNYRSRFGEIDIVAQKDGFLVFCEVKTRSKNAVVSGLESVGEGKRRRLRLTAEMYLADGESNLQPRFDVLVLESGVEGCRVVKHIENAF